MPEPEPTPPAPPDQESIRGAPAPTSPFSGMSNAEQQVCGAALERGWMPMPGDSWLAAINFLVERGDGWKFAYEARPESYVALEEARDEARSALRAVVDSLCHWSENPTKSRLFVDDEPARAAIARWDASAKGGAPSPHCCVVVLCRRPIPEGSSWCDACLRGLEREGRAP